MEGERRVPYLRCRPFSLPTESPVGPRGSRREVDGSWKAPTGLSTTVVREDPSSSVGRVRGVLSEGTTHYFIPSEEGYKRFVDTHDVG